MTPRSTRFRALVPSVAALLVAALLAAACVTPRPPGEPASGDASGDALEVVVDDMTEPHEGHPRGVPYTDDPAWSWAEHPRLSYGNDMPAGWSAFVTWGQVYVDTSGRGPAPNTRVQLRNLQAHYLSKADGRWHELMRDESFGGANYAEDFADDANVPADIRDEAARGGGISATVPAGYNFHFFPDRRVVLDPDDVAGIWTSFEGRLVLDDPDGPDRRAESPLIANAGADYWSTPTAEWDQWTTNGDVGIGRFKYLTPEWQTFNMHTLTEAEMRANPVPVD